MEQIEPYIEALIFASEQGISLQEIIFVTEYTFKREITETAIHSALTAISEKYAHANLAIELAQLNGGYQFLTKKKYHTIINQLQVQRSKKKLSQAALETLAVIAYRQPVTKLEIEQVRGVNCDYTVQKLLDKEIISISGKANTVGKPILYVTSPLFMDYFGINTINELPKLTDIANQNNEIGDNAE